MATRNPHRQVTDSNATLALCHHGPTAGDCIAVRFSSNVATTTHIRRSHCTFPFTFRQSLSIFTVFPDSFTCVSRDGCVFIPHTTYQSLEPCIEGAQ